MRLTSLALAAAIAVSAAAPSFAQPAPTAAPGAPTGRTWRTPDPAQRAERHAERLRAVLQLRPDQEPALRTLVTAMQPTPEQRERRQAERAEMRNLSTPQRLDRMQARQTERQARFAQRAEAIKRFYAQLTPAQQRAFDALPMGPGGMGGRGEHGFGRGKRPDFG
jgi:Spy/CpxP family protein refolding chaperone